MLKSYYDILQVSSDATKAQIKAQFKKLAKMYHPDVNSSLEAEVRFKEVSKAAQILLNDEKRKKYDALRGGNGVAKQAADFGQFRSKNEKHYQKKTPPATDGDDIVVNIKIDYTEAILGTVRIVNIAQSTLCPKCEGHKFVSAQKCPVCGGKGELTLNRKITVKIPPSIKNKTKLRIKGEGNAGFFGGKNGNLYVVVEVEEKKENKDFKIENGTVYHNAFISPYTAILGGDIKVATLWGETTIKIPPLTKTGQSFKLVNVGVPDEKTNKKGDEIVNVIIQIPTSVTDEEYRLYEKLREINASKTNSKAL